VGAARSQPEADLETVLKQFASQDDLSGNAVWEKLAGVDKKQLIRKAASLRVKYRISDDLLRIPVEQVGFHPQNRHGQHMNSERCRTLCKSIVELGFDVEEANSAGVVVQVEPGSDHFLQVNRDHCDGDNGLAPVNHERGGSLAYGTLSHSHLHQILKNIKAGVHGDCESICDEDKNYCLNKLKMVDPDFAQHVQTGLLWQVLSYKMEQENPLAVVIIQAALNAKNGIFLTNHEMEAMSALSGITSAIAEAGLSKAIVAKCRERLSLTMPQFAEDEHFLQMLEFVHDLGSQKGGFVSDLKEFHNRFVDASTRRLRLSSFTAANAMPLDWAWMKVALIKHLYHCSPKEVSHGFCPVVPLKVVKEAMKNHEEAIKQGEAIMVYFHSKIAPQLAGAWTTDERIRWFGNLDCEIYRAAFGSAPVASTNVEMVLRVSAKLFQKLREITKNHASLNTYPFKLPGLAPTNVGKTLEPKVIDYKDGKAITSQDVVHREIPLENLGWSRFLQTQEAANAIDEEAARCVAMSAFARLHEAMPWPGSLDMLRNGEPKHLRVVANVALDVGQITLCPLVRSGQSIVSKTTLPYTLRILVDAEGKDTRVMYALGASAVPPTPTNVGGGASSSGDMVVSSHAWTSKHFPHPFWVVQKTEAVERANCVLLPVTIRSVCSFAVDLSTNVEVPAGEPVADAAIVQTFVMKNTKEIKKGEELVVHWPAAKDTAKKNKAPALSTWKDDAAKQIRKKPKV